MPARRLCAIADASSARALAVADRRTLGRMASWLALAAFVGCAAAPQRTHFDSLASYDRTFDSAVGAMADHKMTFSVQDRRHGNIVAALKGDTITATLEPLLDGTIRVSFSAQNQPPADPGLLTRVAASYELRMSQARILPGGLL
ncbi:MAG: hypothetical protein ACRC2B_13200 [Rubrivivax sp.]